MSWTIIALGNPGDEFKDTRHNTGRLVVERAAAKWGITPADFAEHKKIHAQSVTATVGKENVTLLEPNTFMNNSGKTAIAAKVNAKKLIVIHDDLDLPTGAMKISWNRGAGGHRGVESIIKALKTQEFIRFRIGISPQTPAGKLKKPHGEELVDKHIMGKFKPAETAALKKISTAAAEAIELITSDKKSGLAKAMTQFN